MKKAVVSLVTAALAQAVLSADYTWTGSGASGNWTDPANWGVTEGYPGAGDVAFFNASATITSDFEIGEGTLTVSNALVATSLTFDCTITGAGKLVKGGGGPIHLKKDNFFTGGFEADGLAWVSYGGAIESTVKDTGQVHIYSGAALGSGLAIICTAMGSTGSGSGLYIETAPITITNRVQFGFNVGGGYSMKINKSGVVTFTEPVYFPTRLSYAGKGTSSTTVRFKKPLTGGSNWFQPSSCRTVFEDIFEGAGITMYTTGSGTLEFDAPGNRFNTIYSFADPWYFNVANAWPTNVLQLKFASDKAMLHFRGDQTINKLTSLVFTSSAVGKAGINGETPSVLRFEGKDIGSYVYSGVFTGQAGLCWNPLSETKEFCFSNTAATTTGSLLVSNGTVRVTSGAGFPSANAIVVASNATLAVEATATEMVAESVELDAFAHLDLGADRTLVCRACTTGGVALTVGTYRAADLPGILTGEGRLILNDIPAGANRWQGASGGDWNNGDNWSKGVPPAAGESVYLRDAGEIVVPADVPAFDRFVLEIGTTLVATNWDTCLAADWLDVRPGAKITCRGAWTNEVDRARVWIACRDLTVQEGASIDVDAQGWSAGVKDLWDGDGWWGAHGYGPGAGRRGRGASHGGFGGIFTGEGAIYPVAEYDSAEEPSEAGSGGYWYSGCEFSHGGGAVRIAATGTVHVDGTITANGKGVDLKSSTYRVLSSAGAGGSVWISCATIEGAGAILADGGDGCYGYQPNWYYGTVLGGSAYPWGGRAGGGGRIAVHYGADQTVAAAQGLTVSAKAGIEKTTDIPRTPARADENRTSPDLGTVWFSDEKLLAATFGRGLSGRVVTVPRHFEIAGDFTFTDGWVRLPTNGVELVVTGNFTIDGANSRLELGGAYATNRTLFVEIYGGTGVNKLSVGGDFNVTGGAAFDVRPASTNGTDGVWGAEVAVGGDLTVGAGSRIVCWSDAFDLSSPHFTVGGDFTVEETGLVTAAFRGGSGASRDAPKATGISSKGCGPGAGYNAGGGSHGGVGGSNNVQYTGVPGETYDDPYRPWQAGSGGGTAWGVLAASGGGVVHVIAVGDLTVNGTIDANAQMAYSANVKYGTGSGGTIFLAGRNFTGTGMLTAAGGEVYQTAASDGSCAAGGGGRIAVWTGEPYASGVHVHPATSPRVLRSDVPLANVDGDVPAFAGHCFAGPGTNLVSTVEIPESDRGTPGTVKFCRLGELIPSAMFIR